MEINDEVLKAFVINLARAVADVVVKTGVVEYCLPPEVRRHIVENLQGWDITVNVAETIQQTAQYKENMAKAVPKSINAVCPQCDTSIRLHLVGEAGDSAAAVEEMCHDLGITDEVVIKRMKECVLLPLSSDKEH